MSDFYWSSFTEEPFLLPMPAEHNMSSLAEEKNYVLEARERRYAASVREYYYMFFSVNTCAKNAPNISSAFHDSSFNSEVRIKRLF